MSYENDLKIDEHRLEKEWLKQPALYMQYAEKAALADSKAKRAKENVETIKAERSAYYRKKHSDEGEKFTENSISVEVQTDTECIDAVSEYITAMEHAAVLSAAVKAFEHKKAALENLVRLTLAGYYSQPTEAGGTMQDRAVTGQSKSMADKYNKKRRKE